MASLLWGPNAVYACAAVLLAALSAWFFVRAVRRRESWPRTVACAVSGMAGGASLVMLSRVLLGGEGWSASWLWAGAGAFAGLAAAAAGAWTGRRAGNSPAAWFAFGAVAGLAATILMEFPEAARQAESTSWRWWRVSLWIAIVPFIGAMAGGWTALGIASAVPRIRQRLGEAPPPRGNWRQFSLRSLFELVLVVAVAMSMVSFDREHRGAVALERLEAEVFTIERFHEGLSLGTLHNSALGEVYSTGRTAQAVAMLSGRLESDNSYVRAKAFVLLYSLAPDAPARFVAALQGKDLAMSDVLLLQHAGAAAEPLWCKAVKQSDKRARAAAIKTLRDSYMTGKLDLLYGPTLDPTSYAPQLTPDRRLVASIVPEVMDMLANADDHMTRAHCARLLAIIAPDRQETIDALVRACNDKSYKVREEAWDAMESVRRKTVPGGTKLAPGTQVK